MFIFGWMLNMLNVHSSLADCTPILYYFHGIYHTYTVLLSQKTVTAYMQSKQLLHFLLCAAV